MLYGSYNHVNCLTKLQHIFKEELVPTALRECLHHGTILWLVGWIPIHDFIFALIFLEEKDIGLPKQGVSLVDAKMAK